MRCTRARGRSRSSCTATRSRSYVRPGPGAGREDRLFRPHRAANRLSGHKQWVTNGRAAGTMLVFARAEGGVTAFVVGMDEPGISFGKPAEKMGVLSATTDDVLLDDVIVPDGSRLGEEGKGLKVALGTLDAGRIGVAAQAVGIAEAAFRYAAHYAAERTTFGKAIAEHQAIAFKLAEMQTKIRAARLLTYEAAWMKDQGIPHGEAGARAKLFASVRRTR